LPNIFPTLVLIKFCLLKVCSQVTLEAHCTWANSTKMRRLGIVLAKHDFKLSCPTKFLIPPFRSALKFEGWIHAYMLPSPKEERVWIFHAYVSGLHMWVVYPKPQANKATVTSTMHSISKKSLKTYVLLAPYREKCLSIGNLPWILRGSLPNCWRLFFWLAHFQRFCFFFRNPFLNISISFENSQSHPDSL
jgi:hypothetical protein